jgi:hypothetical protein
MLAGSPPRVAASSPLPGLRQLLMRVSLTFTDPIKRTPPPRLLTRVLAGAMIVAAPACAANGRTSASPARATGACAWPVAPVVLRQAGDTLVQAWTFPAGALPDHAAPGELPALTAFLDTVRTRVGTLDARTLLARQGAYYSARPDSDSQGEAANGRMVLDGSVGTLRPASCLEALLVDYQAARFPMASHPTEFHTVVMEKREAGGRLVRVYFAASSAPWPPKAAVLFEHAEADHKDGWRAVAHLHNHPFMFASAGDIAGANAPSMTDVQFWRHLRDSLGIQSARVTNGSTTFEAPASAFGRLRTRGDR